MNNQRQVLSFNKDWNFYYQLFHKNLSEGNYSRAIFYLKNAIDRNSSDETLALELAKTYTLTDRFELSNKVYFKLLSEGKSEDKCFFGLSQNLFYLNDMERSVYYLNMFVDKYSNAPPFWDDVDEDYIDFIDESSESHSGYGIVYPPEKRDMAEYIEQAKDLMKSTQFEEASQILKKVVKGNADYIYARNNLALCSFFMGDYNQTRQYSEEVLSLDKDNVFALCNLAAMYGYVGHTQKSDELLKRVILLDTEELGDLYKISTTLCELKEHELALKYLKKILKVKPYDYNIMFLAALAYYNLKDISRSEDLFLQLLHYDENDYAVKYYLKHIATVKEENDFENGFFQPLEYICQVPYGAMLERIKNLNALLKKSPAQIKKEIAASEEFMELCDWGFTIADHSLQERIVSTLLSQKSKKVEDFLRLKLIEGQVLYSIKCFIVEQLMLKKYDSPFNINIDYSIKKLTPILTDYLPEEKKVYSAYCGAYIMSIPNISIKLENDLFSAYKKVLKASRNKGANYKLPAKKILSAVIVLVSKGMNNSGMVRRIAMLFGINSNKLQESILELNVFEI